MILLTTPLQAAAEEVGFRGYVTQAVSSWFARPVVGIVVGGAVSAVCFALAHGVQDPWLFADRLCFGIVASWLAVHSGGLEASVALHTANNVVSLVVSAATGTLSDVADRFVSGLATRRAGRGDDGRVRVVVDRLVRRKPVATTACFVRHRRGRLSFAAPAHPAASGAREPLGYGVIGSPTDSGSVSLGSSPGTPVCPGRAGGAVR